MDVPLCDLTQQYLALKDEIDAAMQGVAAEGKYILGPNVAALEQEIAAYCQCRYAVAVNSGTDALYLALRALGIGPGDEVIFTWRLKQGERYGNALDLYFDIMERIELLRDELMREYGCVPHYRAAAHGGKQRPIKSLDTGQQHRDE